MLKLFYTSRAFHFAFLLFLPFTFSLTVCSAYVVCHGLGNFCILIAVIFAQRIGSVEVPGGLDVQVWMPLKVHFPTTSVLFKYRLAWKKLPAVSPSPCIPATSLYPTWAKSDQQQSRKLIPSPPQIVLLLDGHVTRPHVEQGECGTGLWELGGIEGNVYGQSHQDGFW